MQIILISVTIVFYISLCIELFIYKIPSVVVTRKILNPNTADIERFSEKIKPIFHWHQITKMIVFVIPLFFIYLLHLLPLINVYDLILEDELTEGNKFLTGMGIPFIIFGRLISHKYLIDIKRVMTINDHGFIKNGIFKYSRNPGLLGLYLSFFGFFLVSPSMIFLLCYIIYLIHMHFKILMEEDFLTNMHGEPYQTYKLHTKRYL